MFSKYICHCHCHCLCLCHCLFLVMSCLLIPLIKCFKGHKSLGSLCSVVKTVIVSGNRQTEGKTRWPIELFWTAKKNEKKSFTSFWLKNPEKNSRQIIFCCWKNTFKNGSQRQNHFFNYAMYLHTNQHIKIISKNKFSILLRFPAKQRVGRLVGFYYSPCLHG